MGKDFKAYADAVKCVDANPSWSKGYYRKACAEKELMKYQDALASLKIAIDKHSGGTKDRQYREMVSLRKEIRRLDNLRKLNESAPIKATEHIRNNNSTFDGAPAKQDSKGKSPMAYTTGS